MVRTHIPEIKVDTLLAKIREGARRGGGSSNSSAPPFSAEPASTTDTVTNASANPSPLNVPQLILQPDFQPRSDDQYHVNDLLQYHDRDFIQNAYRALLKRYPDAGGYNQFLGKLRDGRLNKIDILARLRFSPEGRARKVHVKGLWLPAVIRRSYSVPVLGYLARWAVGLVRLPNMIRHQQQFEAHVLAQQQLMADHINERGRGLSLALNQVSELGKTLAELREQVLAEVRAQAARLTAEQKVSQEELRVHLSERLSELGGQVETGFLNESAVRKEEIAHTAEKLGLMLEQETERLGEAARGEARELSAKIAQVTEGLSEQAVQTSRQQQEIRTEIMAQARRITLLLEEARSHLSSSFTPRQLQNMADELEQGLDAFYVSFENLFRGSRDDIRERLKVYLPLIRKEGIGAADMPVLDIGCGRGEWLELLQEEGLHARGVDANRVLVADCMERGLDVVEADLVSYLRGLPDRSVGAVTGIHVVEHLPAETMLTVLDESVRVLKSGGVLIFETPNPQNVLVGSYYFHFDPTHRKPLPSPTMRFLFEARGLAEVEVINLHPAETDHIEGDSEIVKRFNEYFYGPMDYAVVGWKV
jgi:SAM-dependent methyltransferase